jgi:small GTP-binding protein
MGKEFTWKIVVLGDPSVGKTSLVTYYTQRSFKDFYLPTLGANFSIKDVELDSNIHVKVYVWDIAGQTKFASIRRMFYEKAVAAIFVFDVTNKATFNGIEAWKADLVESLGPEFPCALVANKTDLERVVTSEEGFEKASDLAMSYFETSAKTGVGVDDAFFNLLLLIHDRTK